MGYVLGVLVVALIFLTPVFLVTWLLHVSGSLVVPVFSRDGRLLARRWFYGLLNWALIIPVAWFFLPQELTPQWLLAFPLAVIFVGFLSGFVLLWVAVLQLFGMVFGARRPPLAHSHDRAFRRAA